MSGTAKGYGGPPEQAGRAFLADHAQLFGIEDARENLRVTRQNASQNGSARVLYQQVYRGVPVLASGYLVAVNASGEVYYVSGDYYPGLELPTTSPAVSAQAVVRHMRGDLEADGPSARFKVVKSPKLVVYVDKRDASTSGGSAGRSLSYYLAYVAEAERRDPLRAFKYVIDAQSGAVLYKTSLVEDLGRHGFAGGGEAAVPGTDDAPAERPATGRAVVTGSGEVYRTNPLHGSPVTQTLRHLRNRSPQELYGYDVDVNDRFGADATSSSGEFDYSPSNFRFDQVMVYYHSDTFTAWLENALGWNNNVGEVDAATRSGDGYAGSYPTQEATYYSDGSGSAFRNPTREASVMAHEQMHIVSEKYDDLTHPGDGDALDEGYSDYFAVAYRHDRQSGQSTIIGEYAFGSTTADRDVDNNYDDRNANNDGYGVIPDFYDASLVFSGALWDFTTDVASNVQEAATITLSSLQYLDADPSFRDAKSALIIAAINTDHGSYVCGIQDAFHAHGIGSACPPPAPSVSIVSGPSTIQEGGSATWTASVSGGSGSYDYTWQKKAGPGEPFYVACFGATTSCTTTFPSDADGTDDTGAIRLTVTDQTHGTTDRDTRTVIVRESGGGGGGGGGCNGATTNAICLSNPAGLATASRLQVVPEAFALEGAYPTPVRAGERAQVPFALPEAARVTLVMHDVLGREVRRIEGGEVAAGHHRAVIGTSGLSSGVYVYRLTAGSQFSGTGKLVVVK